MPQYIGKNNLVKINGCVEVQQDQPLNLVHASLTKLTELKQLYH